MEPTQKTRSEKEIDIIEIFSIICRAKKFILMLIFCSIIIALIYLFFATKFYSGIITIYPSQNNVKSPMYQMAAQIGLMSSNSSNSNYNIPDIVKSRTLSEKIVKHKWKVLGYNEKIDLIKYFDSILKIEKPDWVLTKKDEEEWNNRKLHSFSSKLARERIFVNTNIETGLIKVEVLMEQPKLARDIANFISIFVTKLVNDSQKETIQKNLKFINERLDLLSSELKIAENNLKEFREKNRNIIKSPDLQLELQRLQRDVQIKQEVYITMIKQKEINQIEANKSVDVIRILDKAVEKRSFTKPSIRLVLSIFFIASVIISISIVLTMSIWERILLYKNKESSIYNKLVKIIYR